MYINLKIDMLLDFFAEEFFIPVSDDLGSPSAKIKTMNVQKNYQTHAFGLNCLENFFGQFGTLVYLPCIALNTLFVYPISNIFDKVCLLNYTYASEKMNKNIQYVGKNRVVTWLPSNFVFICLKRCQHVCICLVLSWY